MNSSTGQRWWERNLNLSFEIITESRTKCEKKKLCGESKRGKNNNERKWIEFEEEIDDEKIEFSQENVAENSFKVDTRFALIPC